MKLGLVGRLIAGVILFGVLIAEPASTWTGGPAVRYVAPTGADRENCQDPQHPCRTIQYAVKQAASGDTILVAGGTYTYQQNVDWCPFLLTPAVVCFVDKRLTILGGYSPSNWHTADPVNNPTIIDGAGAYRGVAVIGYHTITSHLEMRGFVIQNCRAQGPTYLEPYDPSGVGGGMLVQHASVTLRDVIFRNNKAIGQTTVSGAGGQADGAGLRIEEPPPGTESLLQRVVFENNESYGGNGPERGGIAFGALFIYRAKVTIEDSEFRNNLAKGGDSGGSGIYGSPLHADALGGGIAIQYGDVVLRQVRVVGNRVQGGNAALHGGGGFGGGIFVEGFGDPTAHLTIIDSYIADNVAAGGSAATGGRAAGGGIDVDSSDVTIRRTHIISNAVVGGASGGGNPGGMGAGGGLYAFPGWPRSSPYRAVLENVVIAHNRASQGSGLPHPGYGGGGGLVLHGVDARLEHVTIAHNRLGPPLVLGQGLLVQPWPSPDELGVPARVEAAHSIIAHHTEGGPYAAAVVVQYGSALTFTHGLFAGNSRNTNATHVPVPAGAIYGLPTMQQAAAAGFIAPGPPFHNYWLRRDSPAVDAVEGGSLADDVDGQPRPYGGRRDFGADEYHPFGLAVAPRDRALHPDWSRDTWRLAGGVGHYQVYVGCEPGASPPHGMACGQHHPVGAVTALTLSGLTNYKRYTVEVRAHDPNGAPIATSHPVTAFPTDRLLWLPLVLR